MATESSGNTPADKSRRTFAIAAAFALTLPAVSLIFHVFLSRPGDGIRHVIVAATRTTEPPRISHDQFTTETQRHRGSGVTRILAPFIKYALSNAETIALAVVA